MQKNKTDVQKGFNYNHVLTCVPPRDLGVALWSDCSRDKRVIFTSEHQLSVDQNYIPVYVQTLVYFQGPSSKSVQL